MKTNIFYFSATGNSLSFAKKLEGELTPSALISIPEIIGNDSIQCNAGRVGVICPVFAWGLPRIVQEFLEKLQVKSDPYIFAIVSCVGIPAKTLKTVQNLFRQKHLDLHAGFVIKAPCSSLARKNALDNIIIALDRKRKHLKTGEERLSEIVSSINRFDRHKPETSSWPANYFGTFFHEYGAEFFKKAAQDFQVGGQCTGCGRCVRICPRANITLKAKKPEFSDNCEFCHACIQWCPEFAITHPNFDTTLKQYRNPHIQPGDLVVNA